jgi:hypothetical protein
MTCLLGNVQDIHGPNSRSQQRLVGITPRRVHDQATVVFSNSFCEGLGTLILNDISPALLTRLGNIKLVPFIVSQHRQDDIALEFWFANLSLDAAAVDGDVAKVTQQFLRPILATYQRKQFRAGKALV